MFPAAPTICASNILRSEDLIFSMFIAVYKNGKLVKVVGPKVEPLPMIYSHSFNDFDGERRSLTSIMAGSLFLLRQPKELNGNVQKERIPTES